MNRHSSTNNKDLAHSTEVVVSTPTTHVIEASTRCSETFGTCMVSQKSLAEQAKTSPLQWLLSSGCKTYEDEGIR